jgi:pyruvate dehydrogenase E1 component alpha subunit
MVGVRVNGTDAFETYAAAKAAVERARRGEGPTLIEAMTYRMLGHTFGSNPKTYVPQAFFDEAEANDPVPALHKRMLDTGVAAVELDTIDAEISESIHDAVKYALASPYPDPAEIRVDIYAQEISP